MPLSIRLLSILLFIILGTGFNNDLQSQNDLVLDMYDSGGNGWEGSFWTIIDVATVQVVNSGTLSSGSSGSEAFSLPGGCYEITVGGPGSNAEISWELSYDLPDPFPNIQFLSGTAPDSQIFSLDGGCPGGCIDPLACNYEPSAILDDGSCCIGECITMNMTDSGGDGWGDPFTGYTEYEIYNDSYSLVASGSLGGGFEGTDPLCLDVGCYFITVGGGSSEFEVGWTLYGIDGGSISGGAPETMYFSVGNAVCPGCMDPSNCLYSPLANVDDGSCCQTNCLTLNILNYDNFLGGGGAFTIYNIYTNELILADTVILGVQNSVGICIEEDGCYDFDIEAAPFGSISWQLTGTQQGTISGNSNGPYGFRVGVSECLGCTDTAACNYNDNFTSDDGSCEYLSCAGCMDIEACNYDSSATIDDGSCDYCWDAIGAGCCQETCVELGFILGCDVFESFSMTYSLIDLSTQEIVISDEIGCAGASSNLSEILCLPDGCYQFEVNVVEGSEGIGYWNINSDNLDFGGSVEPLNDTQDIQTFAIGNPACCESLSCGCTNPNACNYDSAAITDNGSCNYCWDTEGLGCCEDSCVSLFINSGYCGTLASFSVGYSVIDISADETVASGGVLCVQNSGQSVIDLLCLADGCYELRLTFEEDAGIELGSPGSWQLDSDQFYYEGQFSFDTYLTIQPFFIGAPDCIGCMDCLACNYTGTALVDDGSCFYYKGCSDPVCSNYDPGASCDDGSCIYVLGCTYPGASNFDPGANRDDGSCAFSTSTCNSDLNEDQTINTADLLIFLSAYGSDCPE